MAQGGSNPLGLEDEGSAPSLPLVSTVAEEGRGQWPAVTWSRGVGTGKAELSTSLPLGEMRGD